MTILRPILITLLLCAPCSMVRADAGNPLDDTVSVSVGTFLMTTGTKVRVDSTATDGTDVDVERDLGLKDKDSVRLDAYWRFAPRHKVRLLYFDASRGASRQITRDINFGGETFPVDVDVDTRFKTSVLELAYEYAFLRRDSYELAGTIGVHDIHFELGLSAAGGGASVDVAQKADVDGPFPVIGLHGVWRFGEHFHLDAQAQYFGMKLDPYDGHLEDYNVALVWMPLKRIGFGVGYNDFVTRMKVSADRFDGRLRWRYSGARVFATVSF